MFAPHVWDVGTRGDGSILDGDERVEDVGFRLFRERRQAGFSAALLHVADNVFTGEAAIWMRRQRRNLGSVIVVTAATPQRGAGDPGDRANRGRAEISNAGRNHGCHSHA